jgi:hypothetical protein
MFSPWTWKSSGSRTNATGTGTRLLHGGRTRVGGIFLGEGGDSRDPLAYPLYADLPASERCCPNLVASLDSSSIAPATWRGLVGLWSRPPLRHPH